MDGENYNWLLVGMPKTGKTTTALNIVSKQKNKSVIVIDRDINDKYNHFETTSKVDRLKQPLSPHERLRIICKKDSFLPAIENLLEYQENAEVIIEDSKNLIRQSLQLQVGFLLRDFRKKNFNVYYMYHGLRVIPPEICLMADILVLFQTNEDVEKPELKKFGKWKSVLDLFNEINKPGTPLHTKKAMFLTMKK